jgi:molybdopterin-guanine dinucleotide biosynthesis protein B
VSARRNRVAEIDTMRKVEYVTGEACWTWSQIGSVSRRICVEGVVAIPVVSVVGHGNVGKTTFLVRLIRELKRRGYRVGTIKHHLHHFEVDQPGKDTWRHAEAGSDVVVISSPYKIAMIRRLDRELSLEEVLAAMPPVDVVITEGYKRGTKPKIEVLRHEVSEELACDERELIAIVTDRPSDFQVPQFDLDDASGVADLLEREHILRAS